MIQVDGLTKVYAGNVVGVADISFHLPEGKTLVLIGPSGCGKTTTLRMLNRLCEPTRGSISIDDRPIMDLDPTEVRRGMGYVVQGGGLFPHWTAARSIATVPELLNWEKDRIRQRVEELIQLVDLPADFADRYPRDMSGGQRQRIGIARALAADPPIVLWDEPFSALDPITRRQLQEEFIRLKQVLGKTMVLVTHDLDEAFKLGDLVLLLSAGQMQQFGAPDALRDCPANEFVRRFLAECG